MVEARFSCWFCLRYECTLRCPECNLAPYCSDYCLLRDLHRHKQLECIHFGEKTMCALCRKVLFSPTVDCQQCYSVTYCSADCCEAHGSAHSSQCLTLRQAILMNAKKRTKWSKEKLPSVPGYIGHTPALDYLQLRHNEGIEARELNVLLVSFSDVRSVVKTVVDLPNDFAGRVNFYLHENRAHSMARNVLFFYLAVTNPWPQYMTQIWYSTQLSEKCCRYLNTALCTLTASGGYEKMLKATRGLIRLQHEQWLGCCDVWLAWLQLAYKDSGNATSVTRLRHRRLGAWSLSPSVHQRLCSMPLGYQQSWSVWYEDGLLLPVRSVERGAVCKPNPTMFCFNPCSKCSKRAGGNVDSYPELGSSRVALQLAEIVDEKEDLVFGVPSNDNVFAAWDYVQVKAASGNCVSGDLLEMYSQYINTTIYSFCKTLSRGITSFHCLDGPVNGIASKLEDNVKMDRVCIIDAEESLNTMTALAGLRWTLNTSNCHAVLVTHHESWYDANELDRCGNMPVREPALLLSLRDVEARPFVLDQLETRKSEAVCRHWSCSDDYLDAWPLVYRHLQTEVYEFCSGLDEKTALSRTLNVEEFVRQLGFHLKFFFREHHSIVPFRFQTNIRRVSLQKANFVSLEWKPIPVLSSAQ
uniref:MYND-type domain-containing protein n=1 Tax=Strigamia maritima TaxID=126957 RepID=T1J378_STRMM